MKIVLLTYKRQKGLYQSKVTSSLTFTHRKGHQAHNCKMAYLARSGSGVWEHVVLFLEVSVAPSQVRNELFSLALFCQLVQRFEMVIIPRIIEHIRGVGDNFHPLHFPQKGDDRVNLPSGNHGLMNR